MEKIGLEAVLEDSNFRTGLARFHQGIGQMSSDSDRAAGMLSHLGSMAGGALVLGFAAGAAAVAAFITAAVKGLGSLQAWGEQIDRLGDQFGMFGEKAAGFAFLANKVGLSIDEMSFGLNAFTRGMADMKTAQEEAGVATSKTKAKLSPFAQALKDLGVSALNANGTLKTLDEALPDIMDAFEKMPAGVKKSDIAMNLFGARGGSKFLDFLSAGNKGMKEAIQKAKDYGLILSETESNAVEQFGFAQNELKLAISGAWNQIGLAVMPIAKKIIDLILQNMPRIVQLARSFGNAITAAFKGLTTGDWRDFGRIVDRVFGREAANGVMNFILALQGLSKAFQTGGFSGIVDEIGRLFGLAFRDFDLSKFLGDIGGKLVFAIQKAWTLVQPELSKWGSRFWDWLTDKGGALEQTQTQIGRVATEIQRWLEKNGPTTWGLIEKWVSAFWDWLTNTRTGLLITVAENMDKLAKEIERWAEDPKTIARFQEVGRKLAFDVVQGIGDFFQNPRPSGENLLFTLFITLTNAERSVRNFFATIGGSIAGGIVGGIVQYFLGEEAGRRAADAMTAFFTKLQRVLINPGGALFEFIQFLIQQITSAWNSLITIFGGGGLGVGSVATGNITSAMGAVASTQIVSQPVTNSSVSANRSIIVNNTLSGDFSGMTEARAEQFMEQIAQRTVQAVLATG